MAIMGRMRGIGNITTIGLHLKTCQTAPRSKVWRGGGGGEERSARGRNEERRGEEIVERGSGGRRIKNREEGKYMKGTGKSIGR
jgi:hypothetical protein